LKTEHLNSTAIDEPDSGMSNQQKSDNCATEICIHFNESEISPLIGWSHQAILYNQHS